MALHLAPHKWFLNIIPCNDITKTVQNTNKINTIFYFKDCQYKLFIKQEAAQGLSNDVLHFMIATFKIVGGEFLFK